jgi:ribulose-5-phosphate 4-epimerase/fuculose-1-phosphate aldolase
MMTEQELRDQLVALSLSLFQRGYSVGSAGNISVRTPDGGYLMTPTNSSLGRLSADRLSLLDADFQHVGGDKPSKEVPMHRAVYAGRPKAQAVVHLHSTYVTALSCLWEPGRSLIPALTPYFVMRVGREAPVIRYFRPGSAEVVDEIREVMATSPAVILAHHGSLVTGKSLVDAVNAAEELEATAQLALLLADRSPHTLTPEQVAELLT